MQMKKQAEYCEITAYIGKELVMKLGIKYWSDSKTSTFSFHLRECHGIIITVAVVVTIFLTNSINNNALSYGH